jgi:hypothetical protein
MSRISTIQYEEGTGIKCIHCGRNLLYDKKQHKFRECVCSDEKLKQKLK